MNSPHLIGLYDANMLCNRDLYVIVIVFTHPAVPKETHE